MLHTCMGLLATLPVMCATRAGGNSRGRSRHESYIMDARVGTVVGLPELYVGLQQLDQ